MSKVVFDILGPKKEDELIQSFVRNRLEEEENDNRKKSSDKFEKKTKTNRKVSIILPTAKSPRRRSSVQQEPQLSKPKWRYGGNKIDSESLKKRKPRDSFNEIYTDKDRAAAVSAGNYDIKQSLKIKQKQDRHDALLTPEDSDPSSLIVLAMKNIKSGNTENAQQSLSKALELNPNDINALIARSKCHLLLGEAEKALEDAETALGLDKTNIRATYQKAESLYFLGQFEQSLMFFHRGSRARPELASFRLGIQKTQQAIENTIGESNVNKKKNLLSSSRGCKNSSTVLETPKSETSKLSIKSYKSKVSEQEKRLRNARKLIGELCIDKEYLENLLKHPDLRRADTNTENISNLAQDAVDFLNKRQEFWRQQRPCTALPNHKNNNPDMIPPWI